MLPYLDCSRVALRLTISTKDARDSGYGTWQSTPILMWKPKIIYMVVLPVSHSSL